MLRISCRLVRISYKLQSEVEVIVGDVNASPGLMDIVEHHLESFLPVAVK